MAISPTAGTNCWTKAEDLMITVLTGCTSVLTFLGAADVPAALAGNLYLDSMGREPEEFADAAWLAKFPSIIVGSPGDQDSAFALSPIATGSGSGRTYAATGVIEVILSAQANTADDIEDQERDFKNSIGDILEEMTNQPMDMSEIIVSRYGRIEPTQEQRLGLMLSCWVKVNWGTAEEDEG